MLKNNKSVYSSTRAIRQGDLLLRQEAVENQMLQRDPVAVIDLITLKQEQTKLAEMLTEDSFLIKQKMSENEAEKLKFQQEIAKANTRFRVFGHQLLMGDNTEVPSIIGKFNHG